MSGSSLPTSVPVDLLQGAPKAPVGDTREKIKATAKDFEASFISVMLGQMFDGVGESDMSGGAGGAMFKSFLLDAFSKQMAKANGGLGISNAVQREMLKLQGLEG
jgi:Rod binding domain-containing protein